MATHAELSSYGIRGAQSRWGIRTLEERLWSHIEKGSPTECWNWKGTGNRYGLMRVGSKNQLVHRLVYKLTKGAIPEGHEVCHSCDNGFCCNPDHLWVGSHQENMEDMAIKGRNHKSRNKGKVHPKKYSPELVRELREEYRHISARKIAERRGLSWDTVRYILHSKRYQGTT